VNNGDRHGWWQASDGRWYPPSAHPDVLAKIAQASAPDSPGVALARRGRHEAVLPPARSSSSTKGSSSQEMTLPVAAATFGADPEFDPVLVPTAVLDPSDPRLPRAAHDSPQNPRPQDRSADDQPNAGGFGAAPASSPSQGGGGDYVAHYPQGGGDPSQPWLPPQPGSPWTSPPSPAGTWPPQSPGQQAPWSAVPQGTPWPHPAPPFAQSPFPQSPFPQGPFPTYKPPARKRTGLWIGLGVFCMLLVVVLVVSVVQLYKKAQPKHLTADPTAPGTVTATSTVTAQAGKIVYQDNLTSPNSSWPTLSRNSAARFTQDSNGYTVQVVPDGFAWSPVPYRDRIDQISVTATGSIVPAAEPDSTNGMGVNCLQDEGKVTELHYYFLLLQDGSWVVGSLRGNTDTPTLSKLKRGKATGFSPDRPATITAVCATLADRSSTRLLYFLNDTLLTDLTDVRPSLPNVGWRAAVTGASASTSPTGLPGSVAVYSAVTLRNVAG